MDALLTTDLPGLTLFRRGKVRDTYRLSDDLLLFVTTDRISAFDVVMPNGIPDKGKVLTGLSRFWFDRVNDLVPNHLVSAAVTDLPPTLAAQREMLDGRIMIGRRAARIDIECVARGYLAGSGWAEYRRSGSVAGYDLPAGLTESAQLPRPLFTPAHLATVVGADLARELERKTLTLYAEASAYAAARGIILADTKFEFGYIDGGLALIDELLTPDSSRFWDMETYEPGRPQASMDKQPLRDWLEASGWNKQPPAPILPPAVIDATQARYLRAYERLTGTPLGSDVPY
ncbi:MAG: phosphoribosylaminoimidazolesuccinocarboxamide synthase [Thermomicrobia bacterium]|nr:phosphoribosylaminoimidazolesuccinocarboxamide synthase [Thermomicrobia bacterium]